MTPQGGERRHEGSSPRLLIVEDDVDLARIIESLARSMDIEPLTAPNGEAGLEAFRTFRPDMCLVDVLLPQVNGFEVCRRIKQEPRGAEVPVVMMSSVYRTLEQLQEGLAAHGADGFVPKPFTMQHLQGMLRGYLLPEAEAPADASAASSPSAAATPAATVLVVEDDEDLNGIMAQVARGMGLEVLQAYDGQAALRLAEQHKPALCLVDVLLPGLNGMEVCRTLKASVSPPVVILMSGRGTTESNKRDEARVGADGTLNKPFPIQSLREMLAEHLRSPAAPPSRGGDLGVIPMEGSLSTVGLGRLLARLYMDRATGTLLLRRDGARRELLLRHGVPVQARGNAISEALGSLLIERGLAMPSQISEAIGSRKSARSLGLSLVESGVITRAALQETLREQVRLRVVNAFGWTTGEYRFEAGDWEDGGLGEYAHNVLELLREGISRHTPVNELASHLQSRVHERPYPTQVYGVLRGLFPMSPQEVELMAQVDGERTLGQLLQTRILDVTAALSLIWGLFEAGMVDFVPPGAPIPSSAPPRAMTSPAIPVVKRPAAPAASAAPAPAPAPAPAASAAPPSAADEASGERSMWDRLFGGPGDPDPE